MAKTTVGGSMLGCLLVLLLALLTAPATAQQCGGRRQTPCAGGVCYEYKGKAMAPNSRNKCVPCGTGGKPTCPNLEGHKCLRDNLAPGFRPNDPESEIIEGPRCRSCGEPGQACCWDAALETYSKCDYEGLSCVDDTARPKALEQGVKICAAGDAMPTPVAAPVPVPDPVPAAPAPPGAAPIPDPVVAPVEPPAPAPPAAGGCPMYAKKVPEEEAEFDLDECPNLEPISYAQTDPNTYDPNLVDWRAIVKSVEYLANQEPRWCSFAVRSFFHDAGSISPPADVPPGFYGSDGSVVLDKFEFLQPENAYDAFNLFNRVVLSPLAHHFGASFADLQNVAAATCIQQLGGSKTTYAIPSVCEAAGIGLKVGKVDAGFTFTKAAARARVDKLPGNFEETPIWVNFWLNILNGANKEGPEWDFTLDDSLALMGSHTLMDNHACTTDGAFSTAGAGAISTAGCGGQKRMFQWRNDYFRDVTSGQCVPRNPTPEDAEWWPTSLKNAKGRAPNEEEDAALDQCVWKSKAGAALGQNLECVVVRGAEEFGIGEIPEDNDFRFADWTPDDTRAPCCGYHCQTCPGTDAEDPYYCPNSPKGTTFWFYTWQDCDLIYSTRDPNYCNRSFHSNCEAYSGDLPGALTQLSSAYKEFAADNDYWQQYYAYGHCKFSNLGATYSTKANNGVGVPLVDVIDVCKKPGPGGACLSDPVGGKIPGPDDGDMCCVGSCKELEIGKIIDEKACEECELAEVEEVELPELPEFDDEKEDDEEIEELEPGSAVTVVGEDGSTATVQVASLGGA